jgi:hypothetical protein
VSGLPSLPPGLPVGLQRYLETLGRQFEVTQADRGSPLASKPTFQDLVDIGLISANASQALKSNGKTFTLASAKNWLSSSVPSWFTSLLNPPAPVALTVLANQSNLVLVFDAWNSDYYGQTLIYRSSKNDLSTAVNVGSTTGNTYVDNLPPVGGAYYYWVRTESKSKNLSDFNAVSGTTVGNIASAPTVTSSFDTTDVVLTWPTPTTGLQIKYYIIRYGSTFSGGVDVGTSNTNTLRLTAAFGGSRTFWVAAVDINGQLGLSGSVTVTVVPPSAPTVSQTIQNGSLVLIYGSAQGSLPVATYELRQGASWAAGQVLAAGSSSRFETAVNWTGSRIFWVGAYDTAGNLSNITQSTFTPALPSSVTISADVVDNYVLLRWTASIATLTVSSYIVDRGGVVIGSISGLFTAIFETVSSTYTYGVTPVDSAGNQGTRTTTTATVSQPPDYQLQSNVNSAFGGTKTNCAIDPVSGGLLCNVDTSETWATHFSSRGWTSIADQIAAGYSTYAVGKTTGSYQEDIDYVPGGGTVASSKVTQTPTTYFSVGTVSITPSLAMGVDGTTFLQNFPGQSSAFSTAFRYVRYGMAFAATHDGTGLATDTSSLLIIQPLNYRLDVKQKTYQGMVSAVSTDTGGTVVSIAGIFLDVSSIVCSVQGTSNLTAVYDFVDAPNPTQFKVLVFNTAGTRVSATVSYTIRGV